MSNYGFYDKAEVQTLFADFLAKDIKDTTSNYVQPENNMEPVDFICARCKHFRRIEGGCDAFPDGIPDEVFEDNHSKPPPDQGNDMVFEKSDFITHQ
jgi:hypothetical protein